MIQTKREQRMQFESVTNFIFEDVYSGFTVPLNKNWMLITFRTTDPQDQETQNTNDDTKAKKTHTPKNQKLHKPEQLVPQNPQKPFTLLPPKSHTKG